MISQIALLLCSIVLLSLMLISCNNKKETPEQQCACTNAMSEVNHLDWTKNAVIYEVNIRQYTEEGTFAAFTQHIPRLKDLGVDILWIMPVHPIGVEGRKGTLGSYYSCKDYRAVNPEFGTMEDFKNMVKVAHENGMKLIIDWVANHTSRDSEWLTTHPDWYVYAEDGSVLGPFDWTDVAQLNYENADLRAEMIDCMKFWVEENDIDGFRCDVAGMVPADFWNQAREELDAIKPVFMLAEAEQPNLLEKAFDMDYAWEYLHIMNMIAAGEKNVEDLDAYLAKIDTTYLCNTYKMYFLTNHDENSWNGTEFERLGDATDVFAVLAATLPGMPLIYTGQEAGLAKRLEFFEKDPVEDWTANSEITDFYKSLNTLRKENPALWSGCFGGKLQRIHTSLDESVFAFAREKDGNRVVVMANLSPDIVEFDLENADFNGKYTAFPCTSMEVDLTGDFSVTLEPWDYLIYINK